jgi:hypothetical protein
MQSSPFSIFHCFVKFVMANGHVTHSLVFVHGLGGHPQRTWSTEPYKPKASAGCGTPIREHVANVARKLPSLLGLPKKREKTTDSSSAAEEQSQTNRDAAGNDESPSGVSGSSLDKKVFWPRDLLPGDVNDVRVMTFGYYSNPGDSPQDSLYTLSNNLLINLENERKSMVGNSSSLLYLDTDLIT